MIFASIQKRDGRVVPFEEVRITNAILKAFRATGETKWAEEAAPAVTQRVLEVLQRRGTKLPTVEEVQDLVETALMELGWPSWPPWRSPPWKSSAGFWNA